MNRPVTNMDFCGGLLRRVGQGSAATHRNEEASIMTLLIDHPAPYVRRITLNRPERMNALDGPTLQALNDAVRGCKATGDEVKVLVIRGSGRAFCAGNDLKWLANG